MLEKKDAFENHIKISLRYDVIVGSRRQLILQQSSITGYIIKMITEIIDIIIRRYDQWLYALTTELTWAMTISSYARFIQDFFLQHNRVEIKDITSLELTIAVDAPLIVGPCQLHGMPCLESSIPDTLKWLSEPEMERERRRSRKRPRVKPRSQENIQSSVLIKGLSLFSPNTYVRWLSKINIT